MKDKEPDKSDDSADSSENDNPLQQIKGDVIGETAYSQRFVLNILIQLNSENSNITEDLIEKDLCTLWDMTVEKDVSTFLLSHNALDILNNALNNSDSNRLSEVLIGTVANMCCHDEVIIDICKKPEVINNVLSYIKSDDSLIIIQVLRFIFSNVYNDTVHIKLWMEYLEHNSFVSQLIYIMENSINESVLMNCFETLNCICSITHTDEIHKELFIKNFVNDKMIQSLLVAFNELLSCFERSAENDTENEERCKIVFLSIHSNLTSYDSHSTVAYADKTKELFKHMNNIIKKTCEKMCDSVIDFVEYTIAILSSLCFPLTEETIDICVNMLKIWSNVCDLEMSKANLSDFETSQNDNDVKIDFQPILVQYFVRVLKLWPHTETEKLFNDIDVQYIKSLDSIIKNMLEEEKIDKYYENVDSILKDLINGK